MTRGRLVAAAAVCAVAAAVAAGVVALGGDGPEPAAGAGLEAAADWRPWVARPERLAVPPPPAGAPARAEERERRRRADEHPAGAARRARFWSAAPVAEPWLRLQFELVAEGEKDPPRSSRGYALTTVAMHDAVVAAAWWRRRHGRAGYPSEHAAIAGAASRVLAGVFPERPAGRFDLLAEEAARSRVETGASRPSDARAGLALGRRVAAAVLDRARPDRDDAAPARRPRGAAWRPAPGTVATPVQPGAGRWRTWVLRSGAQLRPPPPPGLGSARMRAEAEQVAAVRRGLDARRTAIARRWAAGEGTPLPAGLWSRTALDEIRRARLGLAEGVRALALVNVALADAGVAAWDAKYAYWSARPVTVIRDLGIDRGFEPLLTTPAFPSYVSGHATYSGAASEVLAYLFPDRDRRFRAQALEAAASRLYGGIHFRSDNEAGLALGRRIGRLVVARARRDGVRPAA